ncbi:MAG: type II secretion system F family protein [Thermoguttaceae bacterium]|nr:type II secretion system F family protein [Thermoguttaceae bacterium]
MFLARAKTRELIDFCHRVAISLESGIDIRRTFAREAERARRPAFRSALETISGHVNRGSSLSHALAETGGFFPRLVHELVEVGEETGHLNDIFARLARHYDEQIRLRRSFLGAISWPVLQLVMSILVIGFLIWIMGTIGSGTVDPLGWGLIGNSGLLIYAEIVFGMALAVFLIVQGIRYGLVWTRPVQHVLLRLPGLGPALETLSMARMSWLMHLTLNAGMEIRRAMRMSVRGSGNVRYIERMGDIDRTIASGRPIYEAFQEANVFPPEFLDAVQVGEESGRLVESLAVLSRQYRDRAEVAMVVITRIAGYTVWLTIAVIIVLLIFRLAGFYLGTLRAAGAPL